MDKSICEDMMDFYEFNVEGIYIRPLYPSNCLYPSNSLFPQDVEEEYV